MKRNVVAACLVLSAIAVMSFPLWMEAQSDRPDGPPPGGGKGGPPSSQEAIDACADKAENDACEFESSRGGTMSGACEQTPDKELVCRPIHSEAIKACEEKSEGDACELSSPRGDTMEGTCQKKAKKLACTPAGPPDRGERKAPPKN